MACALEWLWDESGWEWMQVVSGWVGLCTLEWVHEVIH